MYVLLDLGEQSGDPVPMNLTIIIPTLCDHDRGMSLLRAIDSARRQCGVDVTILVVVNGERADRALLEKVKCHPTVHVEQIPQANVSAATRHGRSLVATDAFGFLDDDDVLLPGALQASAQALEATGADLVVSNGLRYDSAPVCGDIEAIQRDPIEALLRQNWLASCAGMFRSSTISIDYFDGETAYCEWTLIAFKIAAARKRIVFLNMPAYRLFDTPGSAYKTNSVEFYQASVSVLSYIYEHSGAKYRRRIRSSLADTLHSASVYHLDRLEIGSAWRRHCASLFWGGWRYLPYTRHLVPSLLGLLPRRLRGAV
jgi:glycosyltransferase involved in cell wall biosynthesis